MKPHALVLLLVTASLQAQSGWRFTVSPAADLWYHGLATVGYDRPAGASWYDPRYSASAAREKRARGIPPTPLERNASELRSALTSDPAFEVLHFVPLYFAAAGPVEFLNALHTVSRNTIESANAKTSFGVGAVASVLTTSAERAVLQRWVDLLGQEWSTYFAGTLERQVGNAELDRLQQRWSAAYAPVLQRALERAKLRGGLVLLIPTLGAEGRLFLGRPADPDDNVIAIQYHPGAATDDAAARVLRELCFPIARAALVDSRALPADDGAAETVIARVAVQCGAQLAARVDASARAAFEMLFPPQELSPEVAAALRKRLD